jgi:hypothetical protein
MNTFALQVLLQGDGIKSLNSPLAMIFTHEAFLQVQQRSLDRDIKKSRDLLGLIYRNSDVKPDFTTAPLFRKMISQTPLLRDHCAGLDPGPG